MYSLSLAAHTSRLQATASPINLPYECYRPGVKITAWLSSHARVRRTQHHVKSRKYFADNMSLIVLPRAVPLCQPCPTASATIAIKRFAFNTSALPKRCMPLSLAVLSQPQNQHISTSSQKSAQKLPISNTILAQQRLRRPLSPHLTIYRPQITSVLSVAMRITGLAMSGAFCLYPIVYSAAPYLGLDVSVASLVASVSSCPAFVKIPIKLAVAWTFTFHCLNALRFISWDMARGITNKQVARTGWGVVGVSFASALALVFMV